MDTLVLTLHIIVCVLLIIVVLLQSGHEGMGVIFGGGSSTMFGSTGAGGLLVKVTSVLAAIFLLTSLSYNLLTGTKMMEKDSVMSGAVATPQEQDKPKPAVTFEDTAEQQGESGE